MLILNDSLLKMSLWTQALLLLLEASSHGTSSSVLICHSIMTKDFTIQSQDRSDLKKLKACSQQGTTRHCHGNAEGKKLKRGHGRAAGVRGRGQDSWNSRYDVSLRRSKCCLRRREVGVDKVEVRKWR